MGVRDQIRGNRAGGAAEIKIDRLKAILLYGLACHHLPSSWELSIAPSVFDIAVFCMRFC
jgi:hypothetical protein